MERVRKAILRSYPVGEMSIARLEAFLEPCHFHKRQMIVNEGRREGYAWFIVKGITRSFWLVDGQEVTTSFSTEGGLVFSMDEMYYGRPSEECVEALEPVDAFSVPIEALLKLFAEDVDLANWGRVIHQNEYRRIHRSHKERLTLPAAERYREFTRQFPQVCARVNLGYIASYLGLTLSTLSRLRSV